MSHAYKRVLSNLFYKLLKLEMLFLPLPISSIPRKKTINKSTFVRLYESTDRLPTFSIGCQNPAFQYANFRKFIIMLYIVYQMFFVIND